MRSALRCATAYRIDYVRLRPDSGGAGRWRGGLGVEKCYTNLAECRIGTKIERKLCPPWGLEGGGEGAAGRVAVFTGGGGGYGDSTHRNPAVAANDIAMSYATSKGAPI